MTRDIMRINIPCIFQQVNKLKMRNRERPSFSLMSKNQMSRIYYVMYNQVDKSKLPTKESFAEKNAKAFDIVSSKAKTDYWVYSLKPNKNGGGQIKHLNQTAWCKKMVWC